MVGDYIEMKNTYNETESLPQSFRVCYIFSAKFNAATNKIRMTNMFEWQ